MAVKRYLLAFLVILIGILPFTYADKGDEICEEGYDIHLFYSMTCPHCKNEIKFLQELEQEYPNLQVHYLEAAINQDFFIEFAEEYDSSTTGVPRTFIGDKAFIGFSKDQGPLEYSESYKAYIGYENQIKKAIIEELGKEEEIEEYVEEKPSYNFFGYLILIPLYLLSILFFLDKIKNNPTFRRHWIAGLIAISILAFFLLVIFTPETAIKNFASTLPFPLFVLVIALADGFNPCAFTVLIILLSLLTYTKDKKTMFIIGLTFIITSALMYFIFIMVMISAADWAIQKYGPIIMTILGIVILIAGMINLKDFFFFNKGISLSISEKHKSKITHRASKISQMLRESTSFKTTLLALLATIILATFVNLVELGCTAILPAVYMVSLINSQGHNFLLHAFWTFIYSMIYIIPLLAILLNFIYTFKSTRLTEKQGRMLKLVAGLFMVLFGIIMLFNPELLMFA